MPRKVNEVKMSHVRPMTLVHTSPQLKQPDWSGCDGDGRLRASDYRGLKAKPVHIEDYQGNLSNKQRFAAEPFYATEISSPFQHDPKSGDTILYDIT